MLWLSRVRNFSILLFGLILLLTNLYKALNCSQTFGCIDPYWANFWLISFSDGYERRALLGHIVGLASGGVLDYRILNAMAFTLAVLVPTLIFSKYFARYTRFEYWHLVFLIFLVGPSTTIFIEAAGDPLHIVFLLCITYFFAADKLSAIPSIVLGAVFSATVVLIHEASLFLFVPAIYLIHCFTHQRKISPLFLVITLIVIGCSYAVILNNQPLVESRVGLLLKDKSIYHAPKDALPSYLILLKREMQAYFGSLYDFLIMIRKTIGVFAFPIAGVVLLTRFFKDRNLIGCFLFIFLFSSPLFVIAHDWGRFLIYDFLMAMLVSSLLRENIEWFGREMQTYYDAILAKILNVKIFVGALPVIAALYSAHGNYRVFGLKPDNVMVFCLALFLMALYTDKESKQC